MRVNKLGGLLKLKMKFVTASLVATSVEYLVYSIFVKMDMALKAAQVCSYLTGVLTNFFLQKRFVFDVKRKLVHVFLGAMLVSLGGLGLNYLVYSSLLNFPLINEHHILAKLGATGTVFFYNFFMKRFVFEKRFM